VTDLTSSVAQSQCVHEQGSAVVAATTGSGAQFNLFLLLFSVMK